MRILSLDPGTTETAFVVWDGVTIHAKGIVANPVMLDLLKSHDLEPYDSVSIEMIACYGMPVGRETFETCVWIGRFIERSKQPHRLVYRKDVKLHICGSPRAKDGNVRQAIIDRFGKPGVKKAPGVLYGVSSHMWAALAVSIYSIDVCTPETLPSQTAPDSVY